MLLNLAYGSREFYVELMIESTFLGLESSKTLQVGGKV